MDGAVVGVDDELAVRPLGVFVSADQKLQGELFEHVVVVEAPAESLRRAETYPTDNWGTTASLSYTFDSMGRLNTMTDNIGMTTLISGATYGPANELLTITSGLGGWGSETRTYNSLKQLVALGTPGIYFTYNYPATGNNGKITSEVDGYTGGETITYAYDSLNRLISASSSASWSQTFTYDGFSNLTATVGVNAPGFSGPCCNLNNQDYGEDANGNPWTVQLPAYGTSASASYDIENRLVSLSSGSSYSYDPSNRRVWRGTWYNSSGTWTRGQDEVTFWSISGRKLAAYNITSSYGFYATQIGFNYYFGAKLIQNGYGNDVYTNRLGSVGTFYPYGVERGTVGPNDTEKFTGYFRDSETGNDYAVNRYESPGYGRFLTPDPYSSPSASDPGSWNKYAYTRGDPVNRVDPGGTEDEGAPEDPGDCIWTICQLIDAGGVDAGTCQNLWQAVQGGDPTATALLGVYCPDFTPGDGGSDPNTQPTCSISLYERGAGSKKAPWKHTYIVVTEFNGSGLEIFSEIIQAGPSNNHWKGGTLEAEIVPSGSGLGFGSNNNNASNPATNQEVGLAYTGAEACADINVLFAAVANYVGGPQVPYLAVPYLPGFYNSNSFTQTLLSDIDLSSFFGSPGWAPGWTKTVPNLAP